MEAFLVSTVVKIGIANSMKYTKCSANGWMTAATKKFIILNLVHSNYKANFVLYIQCPIISSRSTKINSVFFFFSKFGTIENISRTENIFG
jgi:hypothetical protein